MDKLHLTFIGTEYSGKRTLGRRVSKWWGERIGSDDLVNLPPEACAFHDHFVLPWVVHELGHEHHRELSEKKILDLNPDLLEHFQRYQIEYHMGTGFGAGDHWLIDWFYADAVYAPLYYGYGAPGSYAARWDYVDHAEKSVLKDTPEMILVLVKARPEVIRNRLTQGGGEFSHRHEGSLFKEKDTEFVSQSFQKLFDQSKIIRRFEIDTSDSSVDESFDEFISKVEPLLN
jgi:hypothetical protein